jgi:hypothetical protein
MCDLSVLAYTEYNSINTVYKPTGRDILGKPLHCPHAARMMPFRFGFNSQPTLRPET